LRSYLGVLERSGRFNFLKRPRGITPPRWNIFHPLTPRNRAKNRVLKKIIKFSSHFGGFHCAPKDQEFFL
jgi:hypothetical protein